MKKLLLLVLLCIGSKPAIVSAQNKMETKRALLIIDIQNDYFEGGKNPLEGSDVASLKAKKILDIFRKESLPVIHVQHLSVRPEATFFVPNTIGAEIHKNVSPVAGEKIITKNYPNSFRETELLGYLKSNNITELVICGMMTHMCVDATVRAAKDFGFACTVVSDACATKSLEIQGERVSAQEVHYAFLAALAYYYATIRTAEDMVKSLTSE